MKDWCSFSGKPDPQEPTMTTTEGAQPAALPKNNHLWEKSKLLIKFKSPNLLAKWGITDTQILEWAHKWNHKCIPMFELAKQDRPDILIELNGKSCRVLRTYYTQCHAILPCVYM